MMTFVVHVENKPGVLTRVASLFRRRAYNIESLTVGHTETAGISRMTIAVDTDEEGADHVEAHLYKLVNVLRVDNVTVRPAVMRELALIEGFTTAESLRKRSRCSWPRRSGPASSTSRRSRW